MHILEIPSFFPPYGGLFCLDQSKALKACGHEVRILSNVQLGMTIGWKDYLTLPWHRYEHEMDGVTVYQSYQRGIPKVIRPNVKRWVSIVMSMFEDYVKKYGKPDILHAHCAKWAGYAAMKISEQAQIPYVVTEHLPLLLLEDEFGKAPSNAWQIPLLRKTYENAAVVLPVSEELVYDTACYYGKNYKWQSISNIIDTTFFCYQSRPPMENRPFRFCCIADYTFRKGYDILFEACRNIQRQGVDMEIHIAGKNTDSPICQQEIKKRELKGVKTYGRIDKGNVRVVLYNSDCLVLASRSEVQPLVLLEAMSTGIPVISTECIPQSLRIEGGCSIVPIDDAEVLAQAMIEMTKKTIDGKALSSSVEAIASPRVIGKQIEAVLRTSLHTA